MAPPGGFTHSPLRLLTYNTKGLNIPEKRRRLLREAKTLHASVLFLQETHFRRGSAPLLHNSDFPTGYFSNFHGGKSRGVAILFSRSVPLIVEETVEDREGRFLFVKCRIAEQRYTLASLYLPNVNQHRCLRTALKRLSSFMAGTLIVAGDLNVPLDPRFDTSTGRSSVPPGILRHMRRSLDNLQLVDVWRAFHADDRDYSFYSHVHTSYSRLDYFFVQQRHILLTEEVSIMAQTWSDHCPLLATLSSPLFRPSERQWRLNTSLLADPLLVADINTCLTTYFEENNTPDVAAPTIWEAHKAVIRGVLISRATARKRARTDRIQGLLTGIRDLELQHHTSALTSDYEQLLAKRLELNGLLNDDVRFAAQKAKCRFALLENKPGRLLARILRKRQSATYISRLKLPDGNLTSRPDLILDEFQRFYSNLYDLDRSSNLEPSREAIETYLTDKTTGTLALTMASRLDDPITGEEVASVLKGLKNGKSPGPDGLPAEYYRTFTPTLMPHLLALFADLRDGNKFHPHALAATVTVICKPGKDGADVRSYRPISLLNSDLKILAKILAVRLAPLMPSLIHSDQVGFVPGREARDATTRAIGAIGLARHRQKGLLLLSTDAEKAFDRVRWNFMFTVLRRIGVGDSFMSWLRAMYDHPTARVRANGVLSAPFNIHNGTRQGCPLSPLLFAMTLEPLLDAIRRNVAIRGIQGSELTHKVSAYADDLLFFITEPETTLPAITKELEAYGKLSGFKINRDKSEFLNVSLEQPDLDAVNRTYPFRQCVHKMKYLGVWLAPSAKQMLDFNFTNILTTFRADMSDWNSRMISWMGRIAAIKMNLLPRLLYLFGALPILVPLSFFTALRTALLQFIWPKGRPRISFAILSRPKMRGGLALPDPRRYYQASHLLRLVDWSLMNPDKQWLDLELALAGRPLWTLPWLPPHPIRARGADPDPVSVTLSMWHTLKLRHGLSTAISPLLPLVHNPAFEVGMRMSLRSRLTSGSRLRALDLPADGNLEVLPLTSPMGPLSVLDEFNYFQLKSYLRSLNCGYSLSRPLLPFETLGHAGEALAHGVSTLHGLLLAGDTTVPSFVSRWDRELDTNISEKQWSDTFALIHRGSSSTRIQETSYKIVAFWYRSPAFLHQVYPSHPPHCWRCETDRGTYLHTWWSCPSLTPFWTQVRDAILQITDEDLPLTPECFLLLHLPFPLKNLKRSVLLLMIFAAQAMIPALWKTTRTPTVQEWITRVEEYRSIDQLDAKCRGLPDDSATKWYYWDQFAANKRATSSAP
uniref:Reverse transcriptase domain-containing protein n=1 Tax=Leptobrachium leishanense TaxID=445787 RepID=A0A8C5LT01_9ANUR